MLAQAPEISTPAGLPGQNPSPTDVGGVDRALEVFLAQRTRLFRIARRLTGDVGSAEDVVQEAWLRWQRTDRSAIDNPAAFLTTTTTHLAINVVQSARRRHETPCESPLAGLFGEAEDPTGLAERASQVEQVLLLLMARLRPAELAAYLLRKGFDYPYGQIAALLRTSVVNVRQLVRRAQQHLGGEVARVVRREAHRELVSAFLAAARHGDLAGLERVLVQDVVMCRRPTARTA